MKSLLISPTLFLIMMNSFAQIPKITQTLTVNDSKVYYEVYGKGEPLFLLHGYTRSLKFWYPFVADYADKFEVYLVDLKGHGKSGAFKEKLSVKNAADEVEALIKHLKLKNINAIGYSYGGEILFQLAQHPDLIKSMVVVGSCGNWRAKDFPPWLEFLTYENLDHLPWMREHQTSEEQIRSILNQVVNYDISVSDEELKKIKTKTLMVIGDQDDAVSFDCVLNAKKNLPNSYLWIIPNTGHRAHVDKNKDDFVRVSKAFFSDGW